MAPTMETIETLTRRFSDARTDLSDRLAELRDEQEEAKRRRLRGIKNALDQVQTTYSELHQAIKEARALFESPKTRMLHGIRVGWKKKPGKLDVADESRCIAALRKLFGKKNAQAYIRTTEKPNIKALESLPAVDLKKIGVTVADDVDDVLIKASDSEIDKLIEALINDKALEEVAT